MKNEIQAYPLTWPENWKRTSRYSRKHSKFKCSFAPSRDLLFHELKLMGVGNWNIILSTNVALRRDGLPYAGLANPEDPGVAVYFKYKDRNMSLACDQYSHVTENVHAIAKTIEAMRGIARWGASEMLEKAFTGFTALPPSKKNWWEVLEITKSTTLEHAREAWKRLARVYHPDNGSSPSHDHMCAVNEAFAQAEKELR